MDIIMENDEGTSLAELRRKIKDHDQLHPFQEILDDALLLGFLRGVDYDVEKAFEYLESFINVRTRKYKDFTKTWRPSTCDGLDQGFTLLLKNRDPLGRLVFLFRMSAWNPYTTTFEEVIAATLFIIDESVRTYFSNRNEFVFIFDCVGCSFKQIVQISPRLFMLIMEMCLKSIPTRPKAIHVINEGTIFRALLRWVKPLMPKKVGERLQLHPNGLDSFYELVPPSILPTEMGGDLSGKDAYADEMSTRIRGNEEFYRKLSEIISG